MFWRTTIQPTGLAATETSRNWYTWWYLFSFTVFYSSLYLSDFCLEF